MRFTNRTEAGRILAARLSKYAGEEVVVLGVPRGGVIVANEVATVLKAPMDVIVPKKLGAPSEPELAIGAISSWGDHDRVIDENLVSMLSVSPEYIEQETSRQMEEIHRRLLVYRGTTDPPDVEDKVVILVDDGIATGSTIKAAVLALKHLDPQIIVLAVPVAPPDVVERFRLIVDEVVVVHTPSPFFAVGYWYESFDQTSDAEVVRLLKSHRSLSEPR